MAKGAGMRHGTGITRSVATGMERKMRTVDDEGENEKRETRCRAGNTDKLQPALCDGLMHVRLSQRDEIQISWLHSSCRSVIRSSSEIILI